MLHRSRSLFLLLGIGSAAVSGACAHQSPDARTSAASSDAASTARSPRAVGSSRGPTTPAPVVRPFASARDGSAILLAELDGRTVAYVADEDDALVRVIDVDDGRELSSARVGGVPGQLVMRKDGRLLVTVRDTSQVVVLSGGGSQGSKLTIERRVDVATDPAGLALSADDKTLVVTSAWGSAVTVFDADSFVVRAEHAVAREPRGVVVSSDGKRAFVSHVVGDKLDVVSLDGATDAKAKKSLAVDGVEKIFARHMGTTDQKRAACQGFALARAETGRVFAPHVLAFTGDPAEVSSGYGGGSEGREAEVFHIPVIDEDAAKIVPESSRLAAGLENGPGKCALPRAAAVGKAGIFVTCLGDDVVALFDADAVNPHEVALGRWSVPAGPVGISLDEAHGRAVVWSQFAHAITTLAIGDGSDTPRPFALSSVSIPRDTRASAKLERGRALFHATRDDRVSSDGRACASCHPDGRDDTLVWSSPNGPRQTPMLAGRLSGAAPYGWNGDAMDVSTHLVQTFKRLGGKGITGDDKDALMAYVSSLRAPPERKVKDASAVLRGQAIFRSSEAECSSCHGSDGDLPDGVSHDVKSRAGADLRAKFDTPSLRFVGGSAPYFHDGRYRDLRTLLTKSDGKMGHTKHLAPSDLADLEAYLESL
ncbi:MAG: Surface antigen protein [Labilithrix sp.]|nr:Surface antigen protein [Labilithrix sp.]